MTHPLKLRRAAAQRLPGGDPWPAEYEPVPITDNQAESWHATVEHLNHAGCLALVPIAIRRELWRRGGTDRQLSLRLRCGEVADA